MKVCNNLLVSLALLIVLLSSCQEREEVYDTGEYKYYLEIQSEVRLHLSDNAEDEEGMVSPVLDRLSRTIYYMQQAVADNESLQSEPMVKEAALLTKCDSLYRNYADMNPENKGKAVCFVKLNRYRMKSDGTVKDIVTLKYYQFWLENYNNSDDDPSPNQALAKPDSLEAVDLGLSVLWANCNIGAKQPHAYGASLAWGESTGTLWSADGIGWKNNGYTWYTDNYGGVNPPIDIAETALDIVTLNWGDGWHLPSFSEAKELCEQCQWKLRTDGMRSSVPTATASSCRWQDIMAMTCMPLYASTGGLSGSMKWEVTGHRAVARRQALPKNEAMALMMAL